MLTILHTNMRWSFSMRGNPVGCSFLRSVLPITGRKLRPQSDPFQPRSFYSITEERALALDGINHLPDRIGYLWFKARSGEAFQIKTREIAIPSGRKLEQITHSLDRNSFNGMRLARNDYDRLVADRERKWMEDEESGDLPAKLQKAYRAARGGNA